MPAISFDNIPANLRRGFQIEFSSALAGSQNPTLKLLVFGQRLAAGTVAEAVPKQITDIGQAEHYWGRGSMIAEMFRALKGAEQYLETWGVALDEDAGGTAAAGDITFTGPATAGGTIYTYIAGYRIKTAVADADSATDMAAAVVADINAFNADANGDTPLPVTAAVNGVDDTKVDLTCKWLGETGNDIDIRFNYYDGEDFPAGVGAAITAMSGGATNPDVTGAIAAIGAEQYNWIAMPFTDAANLTVLESELDSRWDAQNDGRAFIAYRNTLANTTTFGNGRNSEQVTCMGTNIAPQPPYIWAAVNSVVAGAALSIDPARQLHTHILDGLLPPDRNIRWTGTENNGLLFDGISTYDVDANDRVRIGDQITMYQQNAQGVDDTSFLYINTPETLSRWRQRLINKALTQFPNAKLTDDDAGDFAGNQAVMQPKKFRNLAFAEYKDAVEVDVWMKDLDHYKATFIAQIDPNNSQRLNVQDEPAVVGNYRVHAQHTNFRT